MKLDLSAQIFEKITNIKFFKIRPVGAQCFMLTDGRAGMTKLTVAFRNFANSPERGNAKSVTEGSCLVSPFFRSVCIRSR